MSSSPSPRIERALWIGSAAILALLALGQVLLTAKGEMVRMPSASMAPGMPLDSILWVDKAAYGWRGAARLPARGDVIVFTHSQRGGRYAKRVVGLPGEVVEIRSGALLIDGAAVPREPEGAATYLDSRCEPQQVERWVERLGGAAVPIYQDLAAPDEREALSPTPVPEGHVFVLGDNRDHSADSRHWGPVALADVVGQARVTFPAWWGCTDAQ